MYHVTTHKAATAIMTAGFRDHPRHTGGMIVNGVWVSDAPPYDGANVDPADLPASLVYIVLELPADWIGEYEEVEDDPIYREWCSPTVILAQTTRKVWTTQGTTTSVNRRGAGPVKGQRGDCEVVDRDRASHLRLPAVSRSVTVGRRGS